MIVKMSIRDIIGNYKAFIDEILSSLYKKQVKLDKLEGDHLCFRVETLSQYKDMKAKLGMFSLEYSENIHHGRPITIFKLREPLRIQGFEFPLIELPAPKTDRAYKFGLEHIEFVVPDFTRFKQDYVGLFTGKEDSGPYNQLVKITFNDGKTVKFHQRSLLEILKLEGKGFNSSP